MRKGDKALTFSSAQRALSPALSRLEEEMVLTFSHQTHEQEQIPATCSAIR
jgi:hypothetical protein